MATLPARPSIFAVDIPWAPVAHDALLPRISLDAQYVSERRTLAQAELGGFFVMNLSLSARKLKENFDISAGLYNVFDKRYADSGGLEHVQASIPQDGRSFRVKLNYRPHLSAR